MPRLLGVVEAANAIREHLKLQHMEPFTLHQLGFIKRVASQLGLDHSPEVLTHIAGLMEAHDISIHPGNEYPKWLGKNDQGADIVVNSAEEEAEHQFANAPQPSQPEDFADVAAVANEGDTIPAVE